MTHPRVMFALSALTVVLSSARGFCQGAVAPVYGPGFYPVASPWSISAADGVWATEHASSAVRQGFAQRSAATDAAVAQRVAAARAAESERAAANAAASRAEAMQRWELAQKVDAEDRLRRQIADQEARRINSEREAIANKVSATWKELALASPEGTGLPTDFGGAPSAMHRPAVASAQVTRTTPPAVRAARSAEVRAKYRWPDLFTAKWFQEHPMGWKPKKWARLGPAADPESLAWQTPTWDEITRLLGWTAKPISFDYGINVTLQYGFVYRDGQLLDTQKVYYHQALELAQSNRGKDEIGEWLPLGVFALVQDGQTDASAVAHLAIDKSGMIRGNYFNALGRVVHPLRGAVEAKTQRVAGIVGDTSDTIFQAGLVNLSQEVAPILVSFSEDNTQQWLLVRLERPEKKTARQPSVPPPQPPAQDPSRASFNIKVPADAEVWFDGQQSSQTGAERRFSTGPLAIGQTYAYDIRARWSQNGTAVEQTRTVQFQAGDRVVVDFSVAP